MTYVQYWPETGRRVVHLDDGVLVDQVRERVPGAPSITSYRCRACKADDCAHVPLAVEAVAASRRNPDALSNSVRDADNAERERWRSESVSIAGSRVHIDDVPPLSDA